MVGIGRLKKFLEVIGELPSLALEITLDDRNVLLVVAVRILVIIIIAGSNCVPLGAPLLPPFCCLWCFS
jgi:riboflavin transporter FmnP